MSTTGPFAPLASHPEATAIIDAGGTHSYGQLFDAADRIAAALLGSTDDLNEARIALLIPPSFDYAATQWGIWRAGGIAVPLGVMHPPPEWQYVLDDTQASAIIAHPDFFQRAWPLAEARRIALRLTSKALAAVPRRLPLVASARRAMILYTSGTTSKPKGVVTTHANIQAQVQSLITAWQWTAADHILHILPLHHIHGIINVLSCSLWSGATCEFLAPFDADRVWQRIARGDLTLLMAVPTIYARLIAAWQAAPAEQRQAMSGGCAQMRLTVSGSAALPVSTLEQWHSISGHVLLERYGMTEIGMALSNPLKGRRAAGYVGTPLPDVEVRRVDEQGHEVPDETPGEIEVRGPTVFREYWNSPEATAAAFRDGWFRTGDVAVVENGMYRILGRSSIDIIKTGGYKVSALEIEEVLRTHTAIDQCAVVGVPDDQWGQRVAACVVLVEHGELTLADLRQWAKQRLANYKVPRALLCVDELPRNAMGKVQKPAVTKLFER